MARGLEPTRIGNPAVNRETTVVTRAMKILIFFAKIHETSGMGTNDVPGMNGAFCRAAQNKPRRWARQEICSRHPPGLQAKNRKLQKSAVFWQSSETRHPDFAASSSFAPERIEKHHQTGAKRDKSRDGAQHYDGRFF